MDFGSYVNFWHLDSLCFRFSAATLRSLLQYILKQSVYFAYYLYTLWVICCCSHQFTIYCCYVYYCIVYMYISIFLKSLYIYLIEHSSYWAAISWSTSVMIRFREQEPRKHNKHDFYNTQHNFDLIQCTIGTFAKKVDLITDCQTFHFSY